MEIEYTFQNTCSPFLQAHTMSLQTPLDLAHLPLYDTLLGLLKKQNVNDQRVETIYFYNDAEGSWMVAQNDPLPAGVNTKNIKLRVVMKGCRSENEDKMRQEINELQAEVGRLRESVQTLLRGADVTIPNFQTAETAEKPLGIAQQRELVRGKPSLGDSLPTPEMLKSVSALSLPTYTASPSNMGKRDTDIAYLYAVPIVKEEKKKLVPLSNPIDACKEIEAILTEMKDDNKDVAIRINVGTLDRLRNTIAMRPKILHISCHGGYEMEDGQPKLYLYLERNELNGVVEKYDVDTFKQWFHSEIAGVKEIRPRLVFVSACYSQEFGEAIQQVGVPNVIAVNSDTQVADEAATRFAKVFYHYLTLGRSVKEAFEQTKEDGKVSLRKLKLCCCTHTHKDTCGLLEEFIRNREEAHAKHIPECACEFGGNVHLKTCRWANTMAELSYEVKPIKESPRKVRVCCCKPDLPHNEEEKFVLISRNEEAQQERIFENLADCEPTVWRCFDPQSLPIVDEQLIGRNADLHRLLQALISSDHEHRIISVNGPKGVGKNLLAKTAAKYAMERGFFSDGVITISLQSATWLLSKLNTGLLPPPYKEARSLLELGQKMKTMQKLVIMQCYEVVESNPFQLIKSLRTVLEEGARVKFIILGKKKINEERVVNITLVEDLDPLSAFMIIKRKNPEWPHTYNYFENTDLARVLVTPWLAKRAAYMLKNDSADEVYTKLLKENLIPQAGKGPSHDEYVKSEEDLFNNLKNKCEEMMPIYVLAQLPFGMLEGDLQAVCEEDFGRWKEKAQDFITESSEAQTVVLATKAEDVKERKYKLADVALRYVNEYILAKSERTRYQILCLESLGGICRKIVRSYNINIYKQIKHNEFTAVVDEGIWASPVGGQLSVAGVKGLPAEAIMRFHILKDNFMAYLDPKLLEEIIAEISGVDVEVHKMMKNIKELVLCVFTMLLHLERPQEAMQAADSIQGFAASQENTPRYLTNKKMRKYFQDIIGLMQLLKGGMTFKEPDVVGSKDALRQAEEAEKSFRQTENDAGIGEALFLQALLISADSERKKYAEEVFQEAKAKFSKKVYPIGIARVSIAEAEFMLEGVVDEDSQEKVDTTYPEQLLTTALEILEEKPYYDNMEAECYYLKAMCAEKHKDYNRLREHLLIALEKARCVDNKAMETRCIKMLNHSSTCMQKDYPLFVFLKSFPIVRRTPNEPISVLEPFTRRQSFFRPVMVGHLESKHVAIKTHFDTLTRESLKQAMLQSCMVLQISSEYSSPGALNLEGELGELDQLSLSELRTMLVDHIRVSQCKVVLIMIPQGEEIAAVFADLGVPHVICFRFTSSELAKYEDAVPLQVVHSAASSAFCAEFHKSIVSGETVIAAVEKSKKALIEAARCRMEQFGVKDFTMKLDLEPLVLPADPGLHDVKVLPVVRPGKYIETSPKRGVCDIEKERQALVGRQLELFKIAVELKECRCVNLYGRRGVGKTKLAKELGYFLYMRSYFLSGIYYRGDMQQIHNPKCFVPLDIGRNGGDYSVLFIVDNLDATIWKKTEHFFQSLRDERKYVFLFISQDPLDSVPEFAIVKMRLKPLPENKSLEYIMTCIEQSKYGAGKPLVKAFPSRSTLRNQILLSAGFAQAHGYPKLLRVFAEKILEGVEVNDINLLKESKVDAYFKRVIRHHEANEPKGGFSLPTLQHMHSYQPPKRPAKVSDKAGYLANPQDQPKPSLYLRPEPEEIQLHNMRTQYSRQNSRPAPVSFIQLTEPTEILERQESGGWGEENDRLMLDSGNEFAVRKRNTMQPNERINLGVECENATSEIFFMSPGRVRSTPKIVEPEKEEGIPWGGAEENKAPNLVGEIDAESTELREEDEGSEEVDEGENEVISNSDRRSDRSKGSRKVRNSNLRKTKGKHKRKPKRKDSKKGRSCVVTFPKAEGEKGVQGETDV